MRYLLLLVLLFGKFHDTIGGDSARVKRKLTGYKKILYKTALLHSELNSPLERSLLRHYLEGSGETFLLSDEDFYKLKNTVQAIQTSACMPLQESPGYCTQNVWLEKNEYFGWGLGSITCIYDASSLRIISFADVYDFNKKKIGVRTWKGEFFTRVFRLLTPKSAKPFLVSYAKFARIESPLFL